MTAKEKRYVVARRAQGGIGLAELVRMGAKTATIRRLKGQRFRLGRIESFQPVRVPLADVLRPASRREILLGHPVMSSAASVRVLTPAEVEAMERG